MIKLQQSIITSLAAFLLVLTTIVSPQVYAQSDKQVFIPISVSDITFVIPLLGAPNASVNTQSNDLGSTYLLNWPAVFGASYYEILLLENGEIFETIRVTDLNYHLSIPPGTFEVRIMACNSEDQCGVAAYVGTYTATERIRFAHADILGSPIMETDVAGNVIKEFHYQPFGETEEEKAEDIGYTGHLEDTDLNLTYMQARYYDPVIGRFYSNDPVRTLEHLNGVQGVQGFNRYAYVNNNPYKYTDPDGKAACAGICVGAATAAVWGYRTYKAYKLTKRLRAAAAAAQAMNESAESSLGSDTDTEVSGLIEGLSPETDRRGRDRKGQFVNPEGSAEDALDSLSGETGENGQKTLTDGSVAGVHTSSGKSGGKQGNNTGSKTLHIKRPPGKQDIKIRFPKG